MPGRTHREAIQAYVEPIQQSLSCITRKVLKTSGSAESGSECILTFPGDSTISLGSKNLYFRFAQQFRVVPLDDDPRQYRVQTTYYAYTIEAEDACEIIGYHWHPKSISRINYPHLHLGSGARVGRAELEEAKAHLPTGRVGIEEVIHLLIETFDVKTQRSDWQHVLRSNLNKFLQFASWGKRPVN